MLKQLDANKELLEKLLGDQRTKFNQESREIKKKLAALTKERDEKGVEISRFQEVLERKEKEKDAEIAKLREQVKQLTPKPKPPPPKKKGPLGDLDLDEGPNAPPIGEQLASALRANSTRVLDLFRSWDADGDGQVHRAERVPQAVPSPGP